MKENINDPTFEEEIRMDEPEVSVGKSSRAETEETLDLSSLGEAGLDIADDDSYFADYRNSDEYGEDDVGLSFEADEVNEENCEIVYREAVRYLDTEGANVDLGILLLNRAAEFGSADASIALGKLYAEVSSPLYNKALTFEYFSRAVSQGKGYYYLGLCYNSGVGCEKDKEMAAKTFREGADRGEVDCLCALGICYEFGIGCDVDYEAAVELYTKAAAYDHATAINNLGGCYYYGHGVESDKSRATELFVRAAALGSSNAECRLGISCETGDGCPQDTAAAFAHYERAARDNNPIALYRMALCYDRGVGVDQNFAGAFSYYSRAAKAGYALAMHEAGMMLKSGRGTKKDANEAFGWFLKAAEAGIAKSEYEAANCYFDGEGTVKNHEYAFARFTKAFKLDPLNANAALKIGICYLRGFGTQKDENQAFEWFVKGTELSSRTSAYMLGECYYYGVGTEINKEMAVACYNKAMAYKHSYTAYTVRCILALAECCETGVGIAQDHARALSLYRMAAEFDNPDAAYMAGNAILRGIGIRAEYDAARLFFLHAARRQHIPSMLLLGLFSEEGKGTRVNMDDAKRWYMRTVSADMRITPGIYDFPNRYAEHAEHASQAKIEAQYRLGIFPAKVKSTVQDYMSAYEHLAVAAAMGHEEAGLEIARIYNLGGDLKAYYETRFSSAQGTEDPDKATVGFAINKLGDYFFEGKNLLSKNALNAARCYKLAAELGNVEGCYSYGWCLRHGAGVRENDAEAVKWLKLAADKGNANAAYSYALCCEEGSGTGVKNKREARSYYRKAASSGHVEAARRFLLISE